MTHGTRQRREHALEWIAAGLVAFFIFAGIAFYSFSADVRSVSASTQRMENPIIDSSPRDRHALSAAPSGRGLRSYSLVMIRCVR